MGKLIIDNRSKKINDQEALEVIHMVMNSGRISNHGKQYCYYTVFGGKHGVSSFLNKKSDRFVITDVK